MMCKPWKKQIEKGGEPSRRRREEQVGPIERIVQELERRIHQARAQARLLQELLRRSQVVEGVLRGQELNQEEVNREWI